MKSFLRRILLFLFCLANMSMTANAAEESLLSVSGFGKVEAVPDICKITVSVTTHGKDYGEAQKENAARSSRVEQALKNLGIESKNIKTKNYSFYPTYRNDKGHEHEINGYQAENSMTVQVEDIGAVGKIIDAALSAGANRIAALTFSLKEPENLRRQALALALRDAKEKGDVISRELGVTIAGIKSVRENSGGAIMERSTRPMLAKAMNNMTADSTPIEAGTVSLEATVHIEFLLGK